MSLRSKFIFILIVIQPVIDLITSVSEKYNTFPVSIGAVIKTLFMVLLIIYITHYFLSQNKFIIVLYIGSYLSILITVLVSFLVKENVHVFAEINFALKTAYYLTMIFGSIAFVEMNSVTKKLIYQAVKMISLIVGTSYWTALFTKTSFNSYTYGGAGFSGWFFSANELSVMVILLLGLLIINLNTDQTWTAWLAFILIYTMIPMIGTKTAFLGGGLIVCISIIYALFKLKSDSHNKKNILVYLGIIIIFACFISLTPVASKTVDSGHEQNVDKIVHNTHTLPLFKKILSSRDIYFWQTSEDYLAAHEIRKLFGLGYSGDYNAQPELIEMDFFDLFFSYGMIGSLFLIAPLFYAMYKALPLEFSHNVVLLFMTLSLVLAIAFLAGHVIFAPAVMTYVAITCVALFKEKECGDPNGS